MYLDVSESCTMHERFNEPFEGTAMKICRTLVCAKYNVSLLRIKYTLLNIASCISKATRPLNVMIPAVSDNEAINESTDSDDK